MDFGEINYHKVRKLIKKKNPKIDIVPIKITEAQTLNTETAGDFKLNTEDDRLNLAAT